jgi:hypothetical protein
VVSPKRRSRGVDIGVERDASFLRPGAFAVEPLEPVADDRSIADLVRSGSGARFQGPAFAGPRAGRNGGRHEQARRVLSCPLVRRASTVVRRG